MSIDTTRIKAAAKRAATGAATALTATAAFLARLTPDALALAGGVLVSYGASLVYAPLGFIVGGVMLGTVGVIGAINAKRAKATE
jgi:hypothetical protein